MDAVFHLDGISKNYGPLQVLKDVHLSISRDDLMVVFGLPSSGKTVLLRLLMGLEKPDRGTIILRGEDVLNMPPKVRNIGYVPQDFALYPHKTIFENIAYPLRLMRKPTAEIGPVVNRAAAMLRIEDLLNKVPTKLSGGQKQRVAVARGVIKETDIYLFDDPLAGLDFKLREQLIDDLRNLQEELDACFLYTTADPVESLALAETIAVLHKSTIREIGEPQDIYTNPRHLTTMDILGFPRANLFAGKLTRKNAQIWCETALFSFPMVMDEGNASGKEFNKVIVAVRPEKIREASDRTPNCLATEIYLREDLGAEEILYLNIQDASLTMVNPSSQNAEYDVGDQISICMDAESLFVFDEVTGTRLGKGTGNTHV